jgi:hypothetical protein
MGVEDRCIQGFVGETDDLEDPSLDGRISRRIVRKWDRGCGQD